MADDFPADYGYVDVSSVRRIGPLAFLALRLISFGICGSAAPKRKLVVQTIRLASHKGQREIACQPRYDKMFA
jgi:hypothetical protein